MCSEGTQTAAVAPEAEVPAEGAGVLAMPSGHDLSAELRQVVAVALAGFSGFVVLYCTQSILPYLRQAMGASELRVSYTVSAATIAMALSAPIMGALADAVGRKRVIVAAAFLLSVATFAAAAAPTLGALIAARFVQGLCVPAITGTTIAYITEELRGPHVASVMSMYVSGTVIGGFLGRFVTGVASATWGWRSAFVLLGGATLVAAAVIWWLLPRARQFQRQPHLAASLRTMARHLRNPQLMATCAVGFGVLFGLVGTFTYVGFHLAAEPYRLGSVALGSVFAVYLLGVIVTPLAGRVMHVIGYRRAVALALTVSASGLSLTLAPWLWLKIAGLALVAAGIFVAHAAAASHIAVAVTAGRSSAVGLYVALYYAGGSAGSVIPGLLWRTAGWPGTVAVVLAVQLIAAMTALWSWREPARP